MLSEKIRLARHFALFAELTPLEFEQVIGTAHEKLFDRRKTIFTEGDPVHQVTLLLSGFVKVTQMGLNGNEVILRMSGAGDIVGSYRVCAGCRHGTTAQAVQPSVTLVWEAAMFEKIQARIPTFRRNTVSALEERLLEMPAGRTAEGLWWGLPTTYFGNRHPLVWWSLMLDAQVYGRNPAGFHLTNLLGHLGSVLLLFAALRRLTGATWPVTSQSNRWRIAVSRCLTLGAASSRVAASIHVPTCTG